MCSCGGDGVGSNQMVNVTAITDDQRACFVQSVSHARPESLMFLRKNDYYVDELTSCTVTCQADGAADKFRVGRQTCDSAVHFSCRPSNVHSKRNESECLDMCTCNRP